MLLEAGADASLLTSRGHTCFMICGMEGSIALVPLLLGAAEQEHSVALDARDDVGFSALHHACKSGHVEVVTSLLKAGAKYSLKDVEGRQPLHVACEHDQLACAKALLRAGADVGAKCRLGRTCLHYACLSNHEALAAWLLRKGADGLELDREEESAESIAKDRGFAELVRLLRDKDVELAPGSSAPKIASAL